MSPRLTVLGGPMAGKELTIEDVVDNVLIGSDPSCRFCLDLPEISPIHARLWVDPQGITVYDTNAPQGLFINDDRVAGQAPLRNGDILWLGTPGQEGVVMIQCRIPGRGQAAKAASAAPEEASSVQAPARSGTPDDTTPPPPPPLVMPGDPESTMVLGGPAFPSPAEAARAEDDLPQTIVMHDTTMEEGGFVPLSPAPEQGPVDAPPDFGQPPLPEFQPIPAEPTYDEAYLEPTVLETPAATAIVPPPAEPSLATTVLPPVAATFEDEVEPPAPPPPVPPVRPAPPPAVPRAAAAPPVPKPAPAPRPVMATPRPPVAAPPGARMPQRKPPSSGGSMGKLVVAAVLLMVGGGGAGAAWYFLAGPGAARPTAPPTLPTTAPPSAVQPTQPPLVEPTPEQSPVEPSALPTLAPPSPTAEPSPSGKPSPSPSPSPTKSAKPTPTPIVVATPNAAELRTQQVATLVGQAETALGEKRYDAAAALFDQALQLDPQNSAASRGKASAQSALAAARRSFVAGRSQLVGAKTDKKLTGFESEDVSLSKAPDYSGRLEFEASPKSPRAGESYVVRVFLTNDGKKAFRVQTFSATTNTNGSASGGPMAPSTRELQPQQRAVLQELSGVWRDDITSWSLDVQVQSQHGEIVKSQLTWR